MLIALATGQRAQTLSLIKIENIKFDESGVCIIIDEMTKTSSAKNPHLQLRLPYFESIPELCVASHLKLYITESATKRMQVSHLFITLTGKAKPASIQTISRWLKDTLQASGIDTAVFTGHFTRHASRSTAFQRGVDVNSILKTVGWSDNSKTFSRFYNRPIKDNYTFAKAVFNLE